MKSRLLRFSDPLPQLAGRCVSGGRLNVDRASADPEGRPWSERKAYVWWDEEAGEWTGHDVPDFIKDRPPSYRADDDAEGVAALSGVDPFIMQGDGKGALFVPKGLIDGPLPTHYEPVESPFRNPIYAQQSNPTRKEYRRDERRPRRPRKPSEQRAEESGAGGCRHERVTRRPRPCA